MTIPPSTVRAVGNPMATRPLTKTARQQHIVALLDRYVVKSQAELSRLLAESGMHVTQATLSRDLDELDAIRVRGADGDLVYAVPGEGGDRTPRPAAASVSGEQRLSRLCAELLVSAEASANVVVVRTPPGAAQFFASAMDKAELPDVLGTIAGDDTLLVISTRPKGGSAVARKLIALAARADAPEPDPKIRNKPPRTS
jgi:transcriptional regulator of arginine metabolism